MSVQAREIFRYSSRHGLEICRRKIGDHNQYCVLSLMKHMQCGLDRNTLEDRLGELDSYTYDYKNLQEHFKLTRKQLQSIERGFEGLDSCGFDRRYWSLGRNVAKYAGIESNYA